MGNTDCGTNFCCRHLSVAPTFVLVGESFLLHRLLCLLAKAPFFFGVMGYTCSCLVKHQSFVFVVLLVPTVPVTASSFRRGHASRRLFPSPPVLFAAVIRGTDCSCRRLFVSSWSSVAPTFSIAHQCPAFGKGTLAKE